MLGNDSVGGGERDPLPVRRSRPACLRSVSPQWFPSCCNSSDIIIVKIPYFKPASVPALQFCSPSEHSGPARIPIPPQAVYR
eukprot:9407852-Pyramimonas_sp.AAC.1